jgi:predicted double-glycine peptidase
MMWRSLAFACLGLASGIQQSARAATLEDARGDTPFHIHVVSMAEARFKGVVHQQWDFSCGSAALATLLTYHLDLPTDERATFAGMWSQGDHDKIRAQGFSLYDMKLYLQARHLASDGYRVTLDQVAKVAIPVIVLLEVNGYRHFVVLKGMEGERVLVGDPAAGLRSYERERFQSMWNGIVFTVSLPADAMAGLRRSFNRPEDWRVIPRPDWGQALDIQSLATAGLVRLDANHF